MYTLTFNQIPTINFGNILRLEFDQGQVKMFIDNNDRDNNKQAVADVERLVHDYIGEPIVEPILTEIANKLMPIVSKLKTSVIAGVKL